MIEILAATVGASIGVAAMGIIGINRRNEETAAAIIRLTSAVEHIAGSLETLHEDIKADRRETFDRLNKVENRVSKLEVR